MAIIELSKYVKIMQLLKSDKVKLKDLSKEDLVDLLLEMTKEKLEGLDVYQINQLYGDRFTT